MGMNAMRNIVICVLAISFGLFICGCAELVDRMDFGRQPQQTNLDVQDENICRSRGVTPEYYGFLECKKQIAAERASAEAAAKASRQEGDDNRISVPGQ
jgi:hypothetical protein